MQRILMVCICASELLKEGKSIFAVSESLMRGSLLPWIPCSSAYTGISMFLSTQAGLKQIKFVFDFFYYVFPVTGIILTKKPH